LKRKSFRPKKNLGQNFLYDPAIAEKILNLADVEPGATVIELGPGRGILTKALAKRDVRVLALELDDGLFAELTSLWPAGTVADGNVPEVIHVDFTTVTLSELLAARGVEQCVLLGNIPYNLTRDVLFDFLLDERSAISKSYIMVQREVADRIVSPAGSRVYGITSVVLQSIYKVRMAMRVAPGSFFPPPKVASALLEFIPLAEPKVNDDEIADFVTLVKNLFQQRRKIIQNTLKAFYKLDNEQLNSISSSTGIDMGLRPEALDVDTFVTLYRSVARMKE